ncbi:MAG: hypothetical protein Q9217_005102 [Psora testacea]
MANTFIKRAISPVFFESAPYVPEDVICPGSEEEDSSEENRRKKRRRVEIAGRQYLGGRGLFIQTASLRGPLENGWINPWARHRSGYGWEDIRRYPQVGKDTATSQGLQTLRALEPTIFKARPIADDRLGHSEHGVAGPFEPSASTAKRKRPDELDHINSQSKTKSRNPSYNLHLGSNEWLKKASVGHQARFQDRKSPTPTPAPRDRFHHMSSSPLLEYRHPNGVASLHDQPQQGTGPVVQGRTGGFTPINTPPTVRKRAASKSRIQHNDDAAPIRDIADRVKEVGLVQSDNHVLQGYEEVKRLSQQAIWAAQKADGYLQVKRRSQEAASKALAETQNRSPSRLAPYVSRPAISGNSGDDGKSRATFKKTKPSPKTLPPSTFQPGFEYRVARQTSNTSFHCNTPFVGLPKQAHISPFPNATSSSGRKSSEDRGDGAGQGGVEPTPPALPLESKPAQTKARSETMRKLTFTTSGGPKVDGSRPSSPSGLPSDERGAFMDKAQHVEQQKRPPSNIDVASTKTSNKSSDKPLTNGNRSKNSTNILPEAQIVSDAPLPLAQVVSGPSTNLLETDKESPKLPVYEEGDSYINLSTQAALQKAQRSFKDEVLANMKLPSPKSNEFGKAVKTPQTNGYRRQLNEDAQLKTKAADADQEEPMSTQAMIDEISPFAVTTIKKSPPSLKKRASFAPTPTKAKSLTSPTASAPFPTYSPNMSTSPEASQPHGSPVLSHAHPEPTLKATSSTLTSFSILPNGTLTETSLLQDGQRPRRPVQEESYTSLPDLDFENPFGNGSGRVIKSSGSAKRSGQTDVDSAIEDARSFLGEWNVETEARKVGVVTSTPGSSKPKILGKSILSRRKARV